MTSTAPSDTRPLSPLIKVSFTLGVLLLTLGVFECGLRCTNIGRPAEKLWLRTATDWGTCYSEDEAGYFPLSIRDSSADREKLRKVVKLVRLHPALENVRKEPLGIDDLARSAPYCIVYNTPRRREGFFTKRPRQVALVGDSFVYGEGVKDEDTLGYRLGRKVADTNFPNFGNPGADILGVRAVLTQLVGDEHLRGVIYVFNLNDIFLDGTGHPDVDVDPEMAFLYGFSDRLGSREPSFSERLVAASRLLSLVKTVSLQRRRTRRMVQAFLDRYRDAAAFDTLSGHIQAMADAAKARRHRFLLVIHPLLYKDPFGTYPFASIHRRMVELCRTRRIECVDVYPAFADERSLDGFRVNAVDSHPNGRSNQRVADYLVARAPDMFH